MDRARALLLLILASALGGCGLAGTTTAAGAGAASEAQQAADAKRTEAQVKQQIEASYSQAAVQRRAADTDAQ